MATDHTVSVMGDSQEMSLSCSQTGQEPVIDPPTPVKTDAAVGRV